MKMSSVFMVLVSVLLCSGLASAKTQAPPHNKNWKKYLGKTPVWKGVFLFQKPAEGKAPAIRLLYPVMPYDSGYLTSTTLEDTSVTVRPTSKTKNGWVFRNLGQTPIQELLVTKDGQIIAFIKHKGNTIKMPGVHIPNRTVWYPMKPCIYGVCGHLYYFSSRQATCEGKGCKELNVEALFKGS